MLATEVSVPVSDPDVLRTWTRISPLLAMYWRSGRTSPEMHAGWAQELGIRVDGLIHDPTAALVEMIAADRAMEELRTRHQQAHKLAEHTILHPDAKWWSERRRGVCDVLGLDRPSAQRLYAGAQWYLHWRLSEGEEPVAIGWLLR